MKQPEIDTQGISRGSVLLRPSSKIDKEDELLLPFATWHQCMSGKLRPEVEEQTKKEAKEAKEAKEVKAKNQG